MTYASTRLAALLTGPALFLAAAELTAQQGYQKPPKEVLDILNAPLTPSVSLSPQRDNLLLVQFQRYPPIADLAQPMLRLAGQRINPRTNGPHQPTRITGLTLVQVGDGKHHPLEIPPGTSGQIVWSPDGKQFAFQNTTSEGIELWIGDAAKRTTRKVPGLLLNAAYGEGLDWMPDGQTLLVQRIPPQRGNPVEAPRVPGGPVIQESSGKPSPVRTFQDLLQNPHDENLFDYYAASQLVLVDPATGKITPVGEAKVISSASPSPDGRFILVTYLRRPYSYLLPAFAFPKEVEVWDLTGKRVHQVASLPLADQVPIEGVTTGPRGVHWRPTAPATLIWVEALDGGDPRKKIHPRDLVWTLAAPFTGKPQELVRTEHRFAGLTWGEKAGSALLRDYDRDRKWSRTFLIDADRPEATPRLIWDLSIQDRYQDPGSILMRTLPSGYRVFRQHRSQVFLIGKGANPKGERPFLDQMDLETLKTTRLFQSDPNAYEAPLALLNDDGTRFLTRHESPSEPPNYVLRTTGGDRKALTAFPNPTPQLKEIKRELVTYKRPDGVPLSFTMYLPPGYKEGQKLPAVVWAYPLEFVDAATAGQVVGSPQRFTTLAGTSHLFFLMQGYAVLDGATMPVVGDPETVNNTYIEQIVSSAKAAIDKADEMGVIDRNRVGVGGHSYGAFMTANLLAHSDLFKAGIARSGAYNRTLTPFGFQSERRTIWEAPDIYMKMSPFLHAHKIQAPILLLHGEADNNPGTFPIQSERLYHAIKGNGGTVRYVTLPHESHGYAAQESVEHVLYEMLAWFDRHVKGAGK